MKDVYRSPIGILILILIFGSAAGLSKLLVTLNSKQIIVIDAPSTESAPDIINESDITNNSNKLIKEQTDFVYTGTAKDEIGNTVVYTLRVKPDLSSASIMPSSSSQINYLQIEHIKNGVYQWIEGTIAGLKLAPEKSQCTLYKFDGKYFCTLYRQD